MTAGGGGETEAEKQQHNPYCARGCCVSVSIIIPRACVCVCVSGRKKPFSSVSSSSHRQQQSYALWDKNTRPNHEMENVEKPTGGAEGGSCCCNHNSKSWLTFFETYERDVCAWDVGLAHTRVARESEGMEFGFPNAEHSTERENIGFRY